MSDRHVGLGRVMAVALRISSLTADPRRFQRPPNNESNFALMFP
jgi:hypothetical protein